MNTSADHAIELQSVSRSFGKSLAVDDLTLKIARGTIFGFIGLNGAGKTTAIRMMAGLLAPTSGSIRIAGIEVPRERDKLKPLIGYVPDRPIVYSFMRIREAIEFAKAFYPKWDDARCKDLLNRFALDPQKRIKHLSKGGGAKLSLLLAICHDPQVLLMDEPTSGLDPIARSEFLEGVLAATSERGQTVLFSSHTLADVQRMADSVGLLHEGKLILHSPIDVLLEKTKRIRAVLFEENSTHEGPPGIVWEQVTGREWMMTVENFSNDQVDFVRARNRVAHVDVEDLSLDDVFRDIVRGRAKANIAEIHT